MAKPFDIHAYVVYRRVIIWDLLNQAFTNQLILLKVSYKFFHISEALSSVGVMDMLTPFGNKFLEYDRERTICD
jgi:hypothetical protein